MKGEKEMNDITIFVFVPSSGDLFLMKNATELNGSKLRLVFVPSSGDLFLIEMALRYDDMFQEEGFRPLFWGFVFNCRA